MFLMKDKDATLDYMFDLAEWLQEGEKISEYELIVLPQDDPTPLEVTFHEPRNNSTAVFAMVTGGVDGENYTLTCRFKTDSIPQRVDDRTIHLFINST